jgi:hypothetical protein
MRPIGRLRLTEAIKEKGTIPCSTGKQSRGPMDKDRIRGLPDRTSELMIAKSTAIKDRGGKSGARAAKAIGLTSGDLRRVLATGLSGSQGS